MPESVPYSYGPITTARRLISAVRPIVGQFLGVDHGLRGVEPRRTPALHDLLDAIDRGLQSHLGALGDHGDQDDVHESNGEDIPVVHRVLLPRKIGFARQIGEHLVWFIQADWPFHRYRYSRRHARSPLGCDVGTIINEAWSGSGRDRGRDGACSPRRLGPTWKSPACAQREHEFQDFRGPENAGQGSRYSNTP